MPKNCIEKVLEQINPQTPIAKIASELGKGNTPNNMCSAVYAACISHPEKSDKIIKQVKKQWKTDDISCQYFTDKYGNKQCNNLVAFAIHQAMK